MTSWLGRLSGLLLLAALAGCAPPPPIRVLPAAKARATELAPTASIGPFSSDIASKSPIAVRSVSVAMSNRTADFPLGGATEPSA